MVRTREPQRSEASHPLVPRHDVHERMLQRVAHVEGAGHIWRRNDNREHLRARILIDFRCKSATLFPAFVVVLFSLFGVVLFGDFHA